MQCHVQQTDHVWSCFLDKHQKLEEIITGKKILGCNKQLLCDQEFNRKRFKKSFKQFVRISQMFCSDQKYCCIPPFVVFETRFLDIKVEYDKI